MIDTNKYSAKHRATIPIINRKSEELHSSMVARAKKRGLPYPELGLKDILNILQKGKCEATGVSLIITKEINPYSASIDRIDINEGYTKKNTRIVSYMFNCMKNRFSDKEVFHFMELIKNNFNS